MRAGCGWAGWMPVMAVLIAGEVDLDNGYGFFAGDPYAVTWARGVFDEEH